MNARTLRPDDPDVSASDILGQTERILASRHFRSAKSSRAISPSCRGKETERRGEFAEGVFHWT